MAKYFEVINDNNRVVIDDNYSNLSFVHRLGLKIESWHEKPNWSITDNGAWGRYEWRSPIYYEADLDLLPGKYPSLIAIKYLNSFTNPGYGYASVYRVDDGKGKIGIQYAVTTMELGAQFEIVMFAATEDRVPSKSGLAVYNSENKQVFSAEYGYLQALEYQQHRRDIRSTATTWYQFVPPWKTPLDFRYVYYVQLQRPFIVIGGTIVINRRYYVTAMYREPDNKTITVSCSYWGSSGNGARIQNYQYYLSFLLIYVPF